MPICREVKENKNQKQKEGMKGERKAGKEEKKQWGIVVAVMMVGQRQLGDRWETSRGLESNGAGEMEPAMKTETV